MRILLLLIISAVAFAQPTNLAVSGVTQQQAVVTYTAPSASACTLAVTSKSSYLVDTVYDVDNAVFSNSNSDLSRSDTQTWGAGIYRRVIIGHRATEEGGDGKLYSRSLQANTPYQLTVTCGTAASVFFQTKNIPVGAMAPDPADQCNVGFGLLCAPTMDWSDMSKVYVDHKTGLALRRMTNPANFALAYTSILFTNVWDINNNWTNDSNILSGNTGSLASTSSDTPIFVSFNTAKPGNSSNFRGYSIVGLRVHMFGSGDNATAANRQVNICLTVDSGDTCISDTYTIQLLQNTDPSAPSEVCYPTCASAMSTSEPFGDWALTLYPTHELMQPTTATVNTSGTAVTNTKSIVENTLQSGLFPEVVSGSRVVINGVQYGIASLDSPLGLTLSSTAGTQSGVALTMANAGVKIWKTNDTGSVSLSVSYDALVAGAPAVAANNGSSDQCSPQTITLSKDSGGNTVPSYTARLCYLSIPLGGSSDDHNAPVIYVVTDAGDVWPVGMVYTQFGDGFADNVAAAYSLGENPWDESTGNVFYAMLRDSTDGSPVLAKVTYRGDGRTYLPGPLPDDLWRNITDSVTGTTCNGGEQTSGNLCIDSLSSPNLYTQAAALSARFGHGAFGNAASIRPIGVTGDVMVFRSSVQQDGIAAFLYVDLATGDVERVSDTMWSRADGRWGGMHTAYPLFADDYHLLSINPLGSRNNAGPFAGPYSSNVDQVWRSTDGITGSWDNDSSLTSGGTNQDSYTCPAGTCAVGAVTNTVRLRIHGYPCNANSNANEETNYPCPWDAGQGMLDELEVGDYIGDLAGPNGGALTEEMQVLAKTVNSTTDIEIWVKRFLGNNPMAHADDWNATAYPSLTGDNGATSASWWFDTTSGTAAVLRDTLVCNHCDAAPSSTGKYSISDPSSVKYDKDGNSTGFALSTASQGGFGGWQGLTAGTNWIGNGSVEYYSSLRQKSAAAAEKVWAGDFRAYQGGAEAISMAGTLNVGRTVSTSGSVYSITTLTQSRKLVPFEGWAGRYILKDISPTTITTSTPYNFCVASASNECLTGTSAGDARFYLPSVQTYSNCITNQMTALIPCVQPSSPIGNWAVQQDITAAGTAGNNYRRLTQAFNAPSRLQTFTNWRPTPDAKWGMFLNIYADGVLPTMFLGSIPPWPGLDSARRDYYTPRVISLGAGAATAEIRFGYAENGATSNFYCMPRQDSCLSRSSFSSSNPFNWLVVDGHSGTSCTSGCDITIPVIAGKIAWWQEYRSSDGGSTWSAVGSIQPLTN